MTECQGLAGRLFGHTFHAVFDVEPPTALPWEIAVKFNADESIRALSKRTFRRIYCHRCGTSQEPPTKDE